LLIGYTTELGQELLPPNFSSVSVQPLIAGEQSSQAVKPTDLGPGYPVSRRTV
jgi:hypothetical protein